MEESTRVMPDCEVVSHEAFYKMEFYGQGRFYTLGYLSGFTGVRRWCAERGLLLDRQEVRRFRAAKQVLEELLHGEPTHGIEDATDRYLL